MKESLQTVKELSPWGWGITVMVLFLDMYNARNPPQNDFRQEIEGLKARITVVEELRTRVGSVENGVRDLQASMRELKRIGCSSLTKSQKAIATSCED